MDPLRDLEKSSSTQTMVEDVETKRNLSLKSIEAISEISAKVIETRLVHPSRLFALIEYYVRPVEQNLKTKIIIPISNRETDLERKKLCWVDYILKDFKSWKAFIDAKLQ
jgi:hypothetical protein